MVYYKSVKVTDDNHLTQKDYMYEVIEPYVLDDKTNEEIERHISKEVYNHIPYLSIDDDNKFAEVILADKVIAKIPIHIIEMHGIGSVLDDINRYIDEYKISS